MMAKKRVPKPRDQMVRDCETHLFFLWDALRLYPTQPERYKQIAAELRVLVDETSKNKPLLLNLMDEFGFSYEVQPPGPPLPRWPIPMVGWRDDPELNNLSQEVERSLEEHDKKRFSELLKKQEALARPVPFREYVNSGLAVYIAPYDYSYRDLTLAIARQAGSSHEDESVEEPIVQLQRIIIGGHQGHIAPLLSFAKLVIKVGESFLRFMIQKHDYKPRFLIR